MASISSLVQTVEQKVAVKHLIDWLLTAITSKKRRRSNFFQTEWYILTTVVFFYLCREAERLLHGLFHLDGASSPCGSNPSTKHRFVIPVKVGRNSESVRQLSKVEPAEYAQGLSGSNRPQREAQPGGGAEGNKSAHTTLVSSIPKVILLD